MLNSGWKGIAPKPSDCSHQCSHNWAMTTRQPSIFTILYVYCTRATKYFNHAPGSHYVYVCAVRTPLGVVITKTVLNSIPKCYVQESHRITSYMCVYWLIDILRYIIISITVQCHGSNLLLQSRPETLHH